jgi:hypothetical protein
MAIEIVNKMMFRKTKYSSVLNSSTSPKQPHGLGLCRPARPTKVKPKRIDEDKIAATGRYFLPMINAPAIIISPNEASTTSTLPVLGPIESIHDSKSAAWPGENNFATPPRINTDPSTNRRANTNLAAADFDNSLSVR